MSQQTERQPIDVPGFVLHLDVLKEVWGQILKDTEHFSPKEAERFIYALGKLGYEPAYDYMTREYHQLVALAKKNQAAKYAGQSPAKEPVVPHHYIASLYGGSCGIYVSLDKTAALREADMDAGLRNIMSFRPATQAEVDWHRSTGGRISLVDPKPLPSHYMGENR